ITIELRSNHFTLNGKLMPAIVMKTRTAIIPVGIQTILVNSFKTRLDFIPSNLLECCKPLVRKSIVLQKETTRGDSHWIIGPKLRTIEQGARRTIILLRHLPIGLNISGILD